MKSKVILFCVLLFCSKFVDSIPHSEDHVSRRANPLSNWQVEQNAQNVQYLDTDFAQTRNRNTLTNSAIQQVKTQNLYANQERSNYDSNGYDKNSASAPSEKELLVDLDSTTDERRFESYQPRLESYLSQTSQAGLDIHQHRNQNWRPQNQYANSVPSTVLIPDSERSLVTTVQEPYRGPVQYVQPKYIPSSSRRYYQADRLTKFPTREQYQNPLAENSGDNKYVVNSPSRFGSSAPAPYDNYSDQHAATTQIKARPTGNRGYVQNFAPQSEIIYNDTPAAENIKHNSGDSKYVENSPLISSADSHNSDSILNNLAPASSKNEAQVVINKYLPEKLVSRRYANNYRSDSEWSNNARDDSDNVAPTVITENGKVKSGKYEAKYVPDNGLKEPDPDNTHFLAPTARTDSVLANTANNKYEGSNVHQHGPNRRTPLNTNPSQNVYQLSSGIKEYNIKSIISNPQIKNMLAATNTRYLVIHPNGTIEHVDNLDSHQNSKLRLVPGDGDHATQLPADVPNNPAKTSVQMDKYLLPTNNQPAVDRKSKPLISDVYQLVGDANAKPSPLYVNHPRDENNSNPIYQYENHSADLNKIKPLPIYAKPPYNDNLDPVSQILNQPEDIDDLKSLPLHKPLNVNIKDDDNALPQNKNQAEHDKKLKYPHEILPADDLNSYSSPSYENQTIDERDQPTDDRDQLIGDRKKPKDDTDQPTDDGNPKPLLPKKIWSAHVKKTKHPHSILPADDVNSKSSSSSENQSVKERDQLTDNDNLKPLLKNKSHSANDKNTKHPLVILPAHDDSLESSSSVETQTTDDQDQPTDDRDQPTDDRDQLTDDRDQPKDDRDQPTDNRNQSADDRDKPLDDRDQPTDDRDQPTDDRNQPIDDRDQPKDDKDQPKDDRDRPTDNRNQAADDRDKPSDDRNQPKDDKHQPTDDDNLIPFSRNKNQSAHGKKSKHPYVILPADDFNSESSSSYENQSTADRDHSTDNENPKIKTQSANYVKSKHPYAILPAYDDSSESSSSEETQDVRDQSTDDIDQLTDDKDQLTDDRNQAIDDKEQPIDDRNQPIDDRDQPIDDNDEPKGNRDQLIDDRDQLTDDRNQPTDDREQPTDDRNQPTDDRDQPKDDNVEPKGNRDQLTDGRDQQPTDAKAQPTDDKDQQTDDRDQPIVDRDQPTVGDNPKPLPQHKNRSAHGKKSKHPYEPLPADDVNSESSSSYENQKTDDDNPQPLPQNKNPSAHGKNSKHPHVHWPHDVTSESSSQNQTTNDREPKPLPDDSDSKTPIASNNDDQSTLSTSTETVPNYATSPKPRVIKKHKHRHIHRKSTTNPPAVTTTSYPDTSEDQIITLSPIEQATDNVSDVPPVKTTTTKRSVKNSGKKNTIKSVSKKQKATGQGRRGRVKPSSGDIATDKAQTYSTPTISRSSSVSPTDNGSDEKTVTEIVINKGNQTNDKTDTNQVNNKKNEKQTTMYNSNELLDTCTDVPAVSDDYSPVTTSTSEQNDVNTGDAFGDNPLELEQFESNVIITVISSTDIDSEDDIFSVNIEVLESTDDADSCNEEKTRVMGIDAKNNSDVNPKTSKTEDCNKHHSIHDGSGKNIEIDLANLKHEPIMWVRTTNEDFLDKVIDQNESQVGVIFLIQIDYQPVIEKEKKTTIFCNGTVIIETTETSYAYKDDPTPTIVKETKMIQIEDYKP